MKLADIILTESITRTLYRAKPRTATRYPGAEYWTEIEELAHRYAKKTKGDKPREVVSATMTFDPNQVLNVTTLDPRTRKALADEFTAWFEENYPDQEIDDDCGPYLWEVFVNGETDFAYPTEVDRRFLKLKGINAVYYETEGGEQVKSWYLLK